MKIFGTLLVAIVFLGIAIPSANAEVVVTQNGSPGSVFGCARLPQNLSIGMTDARGAIGVSELQSFLVSRGHLAADLATGYFGNLTRAAVVRYQAARWINTTGFVGPLTRAAIQADSCGGLSGVSSPIILPDIGKTPRITGITPDRGLVGNEVILSGTDFTPAGNTIIFGNRAINNLSVSADGTIRFRIPEVAPSCGQYSVTGCTISSQSVSRSYDIYLVNPHGRTSNAVTFSFDRPTSGARPNVFDVVFPDQLRPYVPGLWYLSVEDKGGRSITASVNWGDENGTGSSGKFVDMRSGNQVVSFTHTYTTEGVYNILFRFVDDDSGLVEEQSARVRVSSSVVPNTTKISISRTLTTPPPSLYVILTGSGFTPTGNTIYFGKGAIRNLVSYNNGTLIYFLRPLVVNPCDTVTYGFCNALPIPVGVGEQYDFSIENSLGVKSKIVTFTVDK